MVGAWSTVDPMRVEQGLGNLLQNELPFEILAGNPRIEPRTSIFLADSADEVISDNGKVYLYSNL